MVWRKQPTYVKHYFYLLTICLRNNLQIKTRCINLILPPHRTIRGIKRRWPIPNPIQCIDPLCCVLRNLHSISTPPIWPLSWICLENFLSELVNGTRRIWSITFSVIEVKLCEQSSACIARRSILVSDFVNDEQDVGQTRLLNTVHENYLRRRLVEGYI